LVIPRFGKSIFLDLICIYPQEADMKSKLFIVFIFFFCCLLPGISLAQDKVVVIPLWSDSGNEIPTVTSAGQVWMDRNLGAVRVAQSMDDYQAYGWLYQWGRLADGHEIRSSTTTTRSLGNIPGHGDFITPSVLPLDWLILQNDGLWQPVSGINNPCPTGFRVPTEAEWETERASWISNDSAGAFASPLKLVVGGNRSQSSGDINNAGISGLYWSSTVFVSYARFLWITTDINNTLISHFYRAGGYSVRCIKD
jgi:uncharacterized protein (TIGR02145 family)